MEELKNYYDVRGSIGNNRKEIIVRYPADDEDGARRKAERDGIIVKKIVCSKNESNLELKLKN